MNILIVGNGFDLSHYLPTKYDHFMVAMDAIENWDEAKGDMGFDDLFGSLYETEAYFFGYTKAMYDPDKIKISLEQIKELKAKLKENVWYQYFSEHVREVKTWIDFETKIKDALEIAGQFFDAIDIYKKTNNFLGWDFLAFLKKNKNGFNLSQKNIRVLELLKLLKVNYSYYDEEKNEHIENLFYFNEWTSCNVEFLENLLKKYKGYNEFQFTKATKNLIESLNKFSLLFNYYINLISMQIIDPKINIENLFKEQIDKVYSFNYTSTFKKNYDINVDCYYLHGEAKTIKPKIILGVSEIKEELLKKYNFWGFTKYHQKLFFDTDFQFLEEYLVQMDDLRKEVNLTEKFWLSRASNGQGSVKFINQKIKNVLDENSLNINFYIWGHSLDISDEIYIKEVFSFNEPYDCLVRVIIYFFNEQAKFDLLANLIHILGKEKVEKWMKKSWLKFEPNPDIAKLNNIEPVELPKLAEA